MTVRDAVITACEYETMSQQDLADSLGIPQGNLSRTLSRKDGMGMRVSTLIAYLENVGGQLLVSLPEHEVEFVLDGESEGVDYARNEVRPNEW